MEKRKKYVAYGSNLHIKQMEHRCPTAKIVGKGVIPDHELLFRGYPTGAVATVEPKTGENVPVLIWDIGPEDEYYLDRYEGYPTLYGKQDIAVETEQRMEDIMVYTMTEGHEIGIPSQNYLNTIANGYLAAGFTQIDTVLTAIGAMTEGETVDGTFVKSVFYSLYFGSEIAFSTEEYQTFADCFVRYEEREREVENEDGTTTTETYTVAVAIMDKAEIYQSLSNNCGLSATYEDQANAVNIWYLVTYNTVPPMEGDVFEDWGSWIPGEAVTVYDLPANASASEIVQLAMGRLGHPYSQNLRGRGNYVDCSYLTMWCYRQIGIVIPGTASEQARYCVENQLTIAKEDLQPGDLVFWSHKPNGRFMNVTHVGVYAGAGMVIDASYSQGKVVYRNLFDNDKQVLYGRPQ